MSQENNRGPLGGFRLSPIAAFAAAMVALPLAAQEGAVDAPLSEPVPIDASGAPATVDTIPVAPVREDASELEEIEVTGSRIRRVDLETASPVFTIDRSSIEQSGVATLGQLLQEMPSIAGAATNPQVNNGGGDGRSTVSLRGLGSERTLLLLNGRRVLAQDVNSIPVNLVERVEILKDGASAIYGSDAIGGVVNFITRKNFNQTELIASYGISQEGDGARTNYWTTVGFGGQNGAVNFGLNFDDQNLISSADREFSRDPFALYYGQQIVVGSSRAPRGRYVVTRAAAQAAGVDLTDPSCPAEGDTVALTRRSTSSPGTSGADFRCFIGGGPNNDTYDFQDQNVNLTPQTRWGAFIQGNYQLPFDIDFFTEAFYHRSSANFQIAPEPFDGRPVLGADVPIAADNVYNIFGEEIVDSRLRLESVGNRTEEYSTHRFQWTGGLKGAFLDTYEWEFYTTLANEHQTSEAHGEVFTEGLRRALGPSFDRDPAPGVQDPVCGTPDNEIPNCVPINFLGVPDPEALKNIAPFVHDRTESGLNVLAFNVNGNVEQVQLPGGALGLAAGIEYREESLEYEPDFLRSAELISGNSTKPTNGKYDVGEIYVEALLPVLADMPFVEMLNISAGLRFSDYSSFGTTTNGKLGVEYRPFDQLLLRGNYATVFRAPTINDLYGGTSESADSFSDPCNGVTSPVGQNANIDAACQNVVRDGSFEQTDSQTNAIVGGNPTLQPEEGDTFTLGFVYSPDWYDPLTIELDYWNFALDDAIGRVGANQRLNQCFNNGLFCDSFSRNDAGEVQQVIDRRANIGRLTTSGVDMGFKFSFGQIDAFGMELGRFNYGIDATYLVEFNNEQIQGDENTTSHNAGIFVDQSAGGDGSYPRWRALTKLDWKRADWSASLSGRYIHNVEELPYTNNAEAGFDPTAPCSLSAPQNTSKPNSARGVQESGAVCSRVVEKNFIVDVQAAYEIPGLNTEVSLGIDNFTNEMAPLIYSGFNGTTDVRTYDTVGRFFWGRVKFTF